MLYAQGFRTAEVLAGKVVPLFALCKDQLTQQPHYDFGLRALKSVLVSAGNLKRAAIIGGEALAPPPKQTRSLLTSLIQIDPNLTVEIIHPTLMLPQTLTHQCVDNVNPAK